MLHLGQKVSSETPTALFAFKAVPDSTGAHKTEALSEDSSAAHVLLGFQLGKVEAGGKDEDVGHGKKALEEGEGDLERHPLGWFEHIHLVVRTGG